MKSLKKFYLKNKRNIFKRCLSLFCCICILSLIFSVNVFASSNLSFNLGGYNCVISAEYHNGQTNTFYSADVVSNENGDLRVNLNGDFNNNTRLCYLKIHFPNGAPKVPVRFLTAVTSAGGTYVSSEWAKPKLNSVRSNDNPFYTGVVDDNVAYIQYEGYLPDTFYIVTWFEYPYDVGYLRTLYISPDIIELAKFDGDRFNQNQSDLNNNISAGNDNFTNVTNGFNSLNTFDNYDSFSASVKGVSKMIDFLSSTMPQSFVNLVYVLLSVGCIAMIVGIVGFVTRRKN